jgi:hypothetical protein
MEKRLKFIVRLLDGKKMAPAVKFAAVQNGALFSTMW